MLSNKPIVRILVEICAAKGIDYVILSPGSRNAPLIISFNEHGHFQCLSIPDERVAGYVALGIAQQTRKPAIITCTSGTASLNFAPAIAEAFYQKIPLLIITADRPVEWIHQGEGQSINQRGVFSNYVKKSYQLPQETSDKDHLWSAGRMIAEAIDQCQYGGGGPVHINIPFREPLYGQKDYTGVSLPTITHSVPIHKSLPADMVDSLQKRWMRADKKMILCGILPPLKDISLSVKKLASDPTVAVLSEITSNILSEGFINLNDALFAAIGEDEKEDFQPDLLLTIGGSFITKRLKQFLRKYRPIEHWHIGEEGYYLDTFQSLTQHIEMPPAVFMEQLTANLSIPNKEGNYQQIWRNKEAFVKKKRQQFLSNLGWCDMKAIALILSILPSNTNLQLGNSTPVRYVQLFSPRTDIHYNSNRGVAGIDGCTSTAAGAALVNGRLTVLITGDIAFFYDSNALWHNHLSPNLRIIIMNNGGGNIFRFIPGPPTTNQLDTFFETQHNLSAVYIAKTFNIVYYLADDEKQLKAILPPFLNSQKDQRPAILEVKTSGEESANVFKKYFHLITKP